LPPQNRENPEPLNNIVRDAVGIDWQMPSSAIEEIDTDEEIFGLPSVNEPKQTSLIKSGTFN